MICESTLPANKDLREWIGFDDGEVAYLTHNRWNNHILPIHVSQAPADRGKRRTTMWPVIHAVGAPTMTEQDVLYAIMAACLHGEWKKANRGTLQTTYDLPETLADRWGIDAVLVSVNPKGRILSAYPTTGRNVLIHVEAAA